MTRKHKSISRVEAYTFHDTVCFFEFDYDTIWGVTKKDELIARWAFKHSSRYITPTLMRQHNYPENFYHFDYHLESDSFLFFSGVNKGKIARLIFNKNKNEFTTQGPNGKLFQDALKKKANIQKFDL